MEIRLYIETHFEDGALVLQVVHMCHRAVLERARSNQHQCADTFELKKESMHTSDAKG